MVGAQRGSQCDGLIECEGRVWVEVFALQEEDDGASEVEGGDFVAGLYVYGFGQCFAEGVSFMGVVCGEGVVCGCNSSNAGGADFYDGEVSLFFVEHKCGEAFVGWEEVIDHSQSQPVDGQESSWDVAQVCDGAGGGCVDAVVVSW